MAWIRLSRRQVFGLTLSVLGLLVLFGSLELFDVFELSKDPRAGTSMTNVAELKLPENTPLTRFDFEQKGTEGWTTVDGRWTVEEIPDAPSGKHGLVQRAVENAFNVIVAPGGPYGDVDISVRFKPISGREDASGGIVFGFSEGRYYVIRANALENNFRLYYYDGERHQLGSARVQPPAIGQWHTLRVVAVGDHLQSYLNGRLLLHHRDSRYRSGQVGLWTKADSITAFDDFVVRGVAVGR